jgi:septal ring factor EnvC (AmiA/AmiB activator)
MVVRYVWMCMFQEDDEEKCLVGRELERRAAKAEEEVKQKDEEMRQKEQLIATLQRQVQHYESRLSECEVRMKSVERQITSLQVQVQYKTFALLQFFLRPCMHASCIYTNHRGAACRWLTVTARPLA